MGICCAGITVSVSLQVYTHLPLFLLMNVPHQVFRRKVALRSHLGYLKIIIVRINPVNLFTFQTTNVLMTLC